MIIDEPSLPSLLLLFLFFSFSFFSVPL